MVFNYSITIDNIPFPTRDDCELVSAENSCSVRVAWFNDGSSEVYYSTDVPVPFDSVMATTERKVTTWSGEYVTHKFLIYSCKASNTTPCNTVENLKRSIISTTFPTDDQIRQFDALIVPTTDFDGSLCSKLSNSTDCPETNLASCQQCMGIVQYSKQIDTCATCPAGKAITNFFDYETTFLLNDQTRLDVIRLGCRKYGACNSLENVGKIKNTLITQFNFDKFYSSTASIIIPTMIVLFMASISELFRLL
jgi:hypothetical protein